MSTINLPDPVKLRERIIECTRELILLKSIEKAFAKAKNWKSQAKEVRDESDSETQ